MLKLKETDDGWDLVYNVLGTETEVVMESFDLQSEALDRVLEIAPIWDGKIEPKKTDAERLLAVQDVCQQAVEYVGSANYLERERHALSNVRQAFRDYEAGKIPRWVKYVEPE